MALANEIGASVFTSSYDIEMRQLIDTIFPFVRVLPGHRLNQNIMTLTQGEGCDVIVKFTNGGKIFYEFNFMLVLRSYVMLMKH